MVGGGGGWACDNLGMGDPGGQGYMIGEVWSDGSVRRLETRYLSNDECCNRFNGGARTWLNQRPNPVQ